MKDERNLASLCPSPDHVLCDAIVVSNVLSVVTQCPSNDDRDDNDKRRLDDNRPLLKCAIR